jgi:transposase InsO family protein
MQRAGVVGRSGARERYGFDAFSRRVVGWSISHNRTPALTTNALGMAIE